MSEPAPEQSPPPAPPKAPLPPPDDIAPSPTPVKRVPKSPPADDRRVFFNDAMREALAPLAGILERKITPLLSALEAIPDEAERLANMPLPGILDQPQLKPRNHALPVHPVAPIHYLRPPGAMAPGEFETVCSRCGKCAEACPARSIQLDKDLYNNPLADGFPYIVPKDQPCVVCDDLACMPACPTGALRMVDRFHLRIGLAKMDYQQCLRDSGETCTLCLDACPIMNDGANPTHGNALFIHEETGRIRVRRNACVGCGLCESRCPTYPSAITVHPLPPAKDPIIA